MKKVDVAVVGGGPGGYAAAVGAAKAGRTVALIEADELGGTCLNRGCIPSKTQLRHAEVIEQIKKAQEWGIATGELRFSFDRMRERQHQVVKRLRAGIASLLKANRIELVRGMGTVRPDLSIEVQGKEERLTIRADKVILATGSQPAVAAIPGIEQISVHTSDTIFDMKELPPSLAIIGGGVIGVEFACIFAPLQVDVTIIEWGDRILPAEDADAAAVLHKSLTRKGVNILTRRKVASLHRDGGRIGVALETPEGRRETLTVHEVLMATGRKPNVGGLQKLDLQMNGPFIRVNERMETSVPHVYAVGDVVGGWQLAHVASAEGAVAAANAASQSGETMKYEVIPRCVYTFPEIASVGYSESDAAKVGCRLKTSVFPLRANGKALAMDEPEGFVKVIAEEKFGEIVGAVIVGPHATEMISEASAFMLLEGTVAELAKLVHPHPALSEGMFEAAQALAGYGVPGGAV